MNKAAMLDDAVAALSGAGTLAQIQHIVRTASRQLVDAHGGTLVLLDGDRCYYADEDAISPLWKGQRFPVDQCISGWCMVHRQPAIVPDISVDPRIPQEAYRPTFVRSLAMMPIRIDAPVGAIGAYWANRHSASGEEMSRLATLADSTGAALGRLSGAGQV
ncbi:MAG TPA: GAF domain-containing protein [Micromonosporaceae bacterium]